MVVGILVLPDRRRSEKMSAKQKIKKEGPSKGYLSAAEAATYLDVSKRTIDRYAESGDLTHDLVGARRKFLPAYLDDFIVPIPARRQKKRA